MDVRSLVVSWPEDAPRGAVTRFCVEHGVSRSWFYAVLARARSEPALSALQPRPRSVRIRHPQAVPFPVEDLAVRIRKELADAGLDHGPVTVRHRLAELGVAAPAASTLHRIFVRHGLVVPQPQKRPRAAQRRFQFGLVDECWQIDAYQWALGEGTRCAVFNVLDDCSRTLTSYAASGETSAAAVAAIQAAIARYQVPCLVLSDNGSALNRDRLGKTTQLGAYLRGLGCKPISGRPEHPQTQGKDERVHQTEQRWLRARPPAATLTELQLLLDAFNDHYNHHRPHQALGMLTPAQARAAGPVAIPPLPHPTPTGPTTATRARKLTVSTSGNLGVGPALSVRIGAEHAGRKVTVLLSNAVLQIFDDHGVHFRTVHLEPGKRYYSNGRPRGRPPKHKRPD